jgi:hypothetical protein
MIGFSLEGWLLACQAKGFLLGLLQITFVVGKKVQRLAFERRLPQERIVNRAIDGRLERALGFPEQGFINSLYRLDVPSFEKPLSQIFIKSLFLGGLLIWELVVLRLPLLPWPLSHCLNEDFWQDFFHVMENVIESGLSSSLALFRLLRNKHRLNCFIAACAVGGAVEYRQIP